MGTEKPPSRCPLVPALVYKALSHLKLHPSSQLGTRGATSGKLRANESAFHCLPRAWALCPLPVLKPGVPVVSSCMGSPFLWASLGESPFCRAGFSEE